MKNTPPFTKPGDYTLQCVGAFDSYKVYPEHVNDPTKFRTIHLNLKVLEPLRNDTTIFNKKAAKEGLLKPESKEDCERRNDQIGAEFLADLVFRARKKDGSLFRWAGWFLGNVLGAAAVIGQGGEMDSILLEKNYIGPDEHGRPSYNMETLTSQVPINCSSMLGRVFHGRIESIWQETRLGRRVTVAKLDPIVIAPADEGYQPPNEWGGYLPRWGTVFEDKDPASEFYREKLNGPHSSRFESQ